MTNRSSWSTLEAETTEVSDGGARAVRVLVVDDSTPNPAILQQLLPGFPEAEVQEVVDQEAFEKALARGDFDVVLTARHLDWITGGEVARAVRAKWPERLVLQYADPPPLTGVRPLAEGLEPLQREPRSARRPTKALRGTLEPVKEHRAQEATSLFLGAFDSVPVGLYRTTPEGNIIDVNAALVHLLGYADRESLLQANAAEMYVNPLERERGMAMVRRDGLLQDYEIQLRRRDGSTLWVLDNVRAVLGSNGKTEYLLGSLQDITHRKRTDEVLERSLESLNRTMRQTIEAMAIISEMRDPYTAGHQKRVARLASKLAEALGLSADRVDGVRLAGLIHDIGKIAVPHEILSKPGRLSTIEFNLIRVHPEVGYEVLKRIDFPWPLAPVVLQHHEVLDGSGYPHGLKGSDILLEARIIGVADVVEAMASHRPYRPALGIEHALEHVCQGRGSLFDSRVVDACVSLFDQGFTFE